MKKVYLAHPISTKGEFTDSKRVAERIRSLGYEVYAAAENNSINDKSNNPTPVDIYDADMSRLLSSDIVVINITGGQADGTITELGAIAGYNEAKGYQAIKIVAYSSNARLLQPQFYKGIPSASANHLSLGAVEKWGNFYGNEEEMIRQLELPPVCNDDDEIFEKLNGFINNIHDIYDTTDIAEFIREYRKDILNIIK